MPLSRTSVVACRTEWLHVTASVDSLRATRRLLLRRLRDRRTIVESEPVHLRRILFQSPAHRRKSKKKGLRTGPAILKIHPIFNDHLPYTTGLPNASPSDVVATQAESFVDIGNDTSSHSSTDTTDLNIPTNDGDIVAVFQKLKCNILLNVVIQYTLYPVVSTLDTGADPNLVDLSFLHPLWRKHTRPAIKLRLKLASNKKIHTGDLIKLLVLLADLHACVAFEVVNNLFVSNLLGRLYIDQFITRIVPLEQRIVPVH